jgi:hypothetical protein
MAGHPTQVAYPGTWVPPPQMAEGAVPMGVLPGSAARAGGRHKRKLYDNRRNDRSGTGKKPHQLQVKNGGEIDAGSDGKNAWDAALRLHVPRVLDISIVDWELQRAESVQLLRDKLDAEFKYVGNRLGTQGFRNAIKRYLKSERSRLKTRFLSGQTDCPLHVEPAQWEKLKVYWSNDLHREKSAKMASARRHVKNYSTVGRKGRAGLEAKLVRGSSMIPYCLRSNVTLAIAFILLTVAAFFPFYPEAPLLIYSTHSHCRRIVFSTRSWN